MKRRIDIVVLGETMLCGLSDHLTSRGLQSNRYDTDEKTGNPGKEPDGDEETEEQLRAALDDFRSRLEAEQKQQPAAATA